MNISFNKIYKLIIMIVISLMVLSISNFTYAESEKITNDFKVEGMTSFDDFIVYSVFFKKGDTNIRLSIDAKDYGLPSNLSNYKDDVLLRITYSEDELKVYDCKVINRKKGEIIEDLSDENIKKLFDVEYGKIVINKIWTNEIKLSELKENVIYKYTAIAHEQFPKIENDLGKNYILYTKRKYNNIYDKEYDKEIIMNKNFIEYSHLSYIAYNSGDSFNIMYKTLTNTELLNMVEEESVIYLSKYSDLTNLVYDYNTKYIYNDTDRDLMIHTKNGLFGGVELKHTIIKKGEICGFDWMIDSAVVDYDLNNNGNDTNTNTNTPNIDSTNIVASIPSNNNSNNNGSTSENNKTNEEKDKQNTSETLANEKQNRYKKVLELLGNGKVSYANVKKVDTPADSKFPRTGIEINPLLIAAYVVFSVSIIGIIYLFIISKKNKNNK